MSAWQNHDGLPVIMGGQIHRDLISIERGGGFRMYTITYSPMNTWIPIGGWFHGKFL